MNLKPKITIAFYVCLYLSFYFCKLSEYFVSTVKISIPEQISLIANAITICVCVCVYFYCQPPKLFNT